MLRPDNAAGFKGVNSIGKRWRARITVLGLRIDLGSYDTPEEAHAAYCAAARTYFGEFANHGA